MKPHSHRQHSARLRNWAVKMQNCLIASKRQICSRRTRVLWQRMSAPFEVRFSLWSAGGNNGAVNNAAPPTHFRAAFSSSIVCKSSTPFLSNFTHSKTGAGLPVRKSIASPDFPLSKGQIRCFKNVPSSILAFMIGMVVVSFALAWPVMLMFWRMVFGMWLASSKL